MGFLEGLTIIFIALKLIGTISWSWWLVISPMYPAILLYIVLISIFGTAVFNVFRAFK